MFRVEVSEKVGKLGKLMICLLLLKPVNWYSNISFQAYLSPKMYSTNCRVLKSGLSINANGALSAFTTSK